MVHVATGMSRLDYYAAPTAGVLWWLIIRHEYLPFRDGWVSGLLLLALAGAALEGARLLIRPVPGGRTTLCFDFAGRVFL